MSGQRKHSEELASRDGGASGPSVCEWLRGGIKDGKSALCLAIQLLVVAGLLGFLIYVLKMETGRSYGEVIRIDEERLETKEGCIAVLVEMAEFPSQAVIWRRAMISAIIGAATSVALLALTKPDLTPLQVFFVIALPTFFCSFFVQNYHTFHGFPHLHRKFAQKAVQTLREKHGIDAIETDEQRAKTEAHGILG